MEEFKVHKLADFGSEEPWVARIWISFWEFIEKLHLSDEGKKKIVSAFNDLSQTLSLAFISLRNIKRDSADPNVPLLNVQKEYFDFYDELWTAYKDRFQKAIKELGFDIGFLFQNDINFNKGLKEFSEKYDVPDDIQSVIIDDRIWSNRLSILRNKYLQHKTLPKEIEKNFFNIEQAEVYFYNIWTLIEDFTIRLMAFRLPSFCMFQEIDEEKRDKACPKRFEITINPNFFKKVETE